MAFHLTKNEYSVSICRRCLSMLLGFYQTFIGSGSFALWAVKASVLAFCSPLKPSIYMVQEIL